MANSRMNTVTRTSLHVAFLSFAFSIVLAGPLQKRASRERTELNKTSLRQSTNCEAACRQCRFRLCEYDIYGDKVQKRDIGAPIVLPAREGIASYPWICSGDGSVLVGLVKVADEVTIQQDDGNFVKISKFKPRDLRTRFTKRAITPRSLNAPAVPGCSGLALGRSLRPDQQNALDGRCIIMPIKRFESLRPDGSVKSVLNARGDDNCLGFKAVSKQPVVKIELHWTNQDDMDLIVREPNGDIISYSSGHSDSGGHLVKDETIGDCRSGKQERDVMEYIVWPADASPQRGQYEITVNHYSSCHKGALEWFLFVDVDGENYFFETGVHNLNEGELDVDIDTFLLVLSS